MSSQRARITARAYDLWVRRGKPIGSPEVDWYEAQTQIENEVNDPAAPKTALDPPAQKAADVLAADVTPASRPGASADDPNATETTPPDGPMPKRSRAGRKSGRPGSDNGAARE
jgi:hypothetical protein